MMYYLLIQTTKTIFQKLVRTRYILQRVGDPQINNTKKDQIDTKNRIKANTTTAGPQIVIVNLLLEQKS